MSLPYPVPSRVTGGCLCGGVRYEVNFSANHDWKTASADCQCTMCRKASGCLAIPWHTIDPATELKWLSKETYSEYSASPGRYRGFCSRCGGQLTWRSTKSFDLAVGSFDEEFLIGKRESDKVKGEGGFGLALYRSDAKHIYTVNEIKGVTDHWEGPKFMED